ncbi:MAG: IS1595 family transposase [Desulfurellales bacterium]|nr:MAG: IS1595 family transposase [Desulfurellales bacterium]
MNFNFKNISEFNEYFRDERKCYEFYESVRWNGQPACPHCGSTKKPYNVKPRGKFKDIPSYRCSEKECDLPFTVRTGSIFEGSKVEFKKWLQAIYELSISKKGISSVELGERIGVSQKTGWLINHRLRNMLNHSAPELLTGTVESDSTWIGGKTGNFSNSKRRILKATGESVATSGKDLMVGIVQKPTDTTPARVVVKHITPQTKHATREFIKATVAKGAQLHTDEGREFNGLSQLYDHKVVNHSQNIYVDGDVTTNTIEGFWSLLKRGIVGTFHVVSAQHLQKYCDEFSHRYNTRKGQPDFRFNDYLQRSQVERITYKELTNTGILGEGTKRWALAKAKYKWLKDTNQLPDNDRAQKKR